MVETPALPRKRSICKGCPGVHEACLWQGGGDNPAHLVVIGRNPSWNSIGKNKPFEDTSDRTFLRLLAESQRKLHIEKLETYYTYATLVGAYKPNVDHYKTCNANLQRELANIRGLPGKMPVVVTLGPEAARAVGVTFKRIQEAMGRAYSVNVPSPLGPRTWKVFPIISMADLSRQPGVVPVVSSVLQRALKASLGIEEAASVDPSVLAKEYRYPKSEQELKALIDEIIYYAGPESKSGPENWMVSVDTETNTLHSFRHDAKTLMVSVAWDDGKAATILLDHPDAPYPAEVGWREVGRLLASAKPKVFHNFKFDLKFLEFKGVPIQRVVWDTFLGEHYLDEDKKGYYGLKKLTPNYIPAYTGYEDELHETLRAEEEKAEAEAQEEEVAAAGAGEKPEKKKRRAKKDKGFEEVPLSQLMTYAGIDSDATRQIAKRQIARVHKANIQDHAYSVMHSLLLPASRIFAKMEHRGLRVDRDRLEEIRTGVTKMRDDALNFLRKEYSPTVLYTSPAQVAKLMGALNFESVDGVTPGSTSEDNLHKYYRYYGEDDARGRGQFIKQFLRYRAAENALSKHIDNKIMKHLRPDGKLHGGFNQAGTSSGRCASSEPNMANIPKMICDISIKDREGKTNVIEPGFNFKSIFIPDRPGQVFMNVDIQGAELRVYTAYSHDEVMIRELLAGTDIHSFTVSRCFGISYDEVIKRKKLKDLLIEKMRLQAKRVLFGIFYGAGANKVAEQIESTREFAEEIIRAIFATYTGLRPYIEKTHAEVIRNRFVQSNFGRFRRFKMATISEMQMSEAKRQAVNFLIQSTSHDLLTSQMIEIDEHAAEVGLELCLEIHDALAGSLDESSVPKMKAFFDEHIVESVKRRFPWLPVPFLYDMEIGPNYGEMKKVS